MALALLYLFNVKVRFFIILTTVFAAVLPISLSALPCDGPLEFVFQGRTENQLLVAFSPELIRHAGLTVLAPEVVKIESLHGNFVLRLSAPNQNLLFENFANRFFLEAPHVSTLRIRTLSQPDSKVITNALNQRLGIQVPEDTQISVSAFVPFHDGAEELARLHVTDSLRETLIEYARTLDTPRNRKETSAQLELLWKQASEEDKKALLHDLHRIFPQRNPGIWDSVRSLFRPALTIEEVVRVVENHPPFAFRALEPLCFSRLPPHLLEKLADYWALAHVIGISDVHENNWLIHDDRIVAIDLALPSPEFEKGTATLTSKTFTSPFGKILSTELAHQLLARSVSPAMKKYLRELTPEKIDQFSNEAKLVILPQQKAGILGRAKLVLALP